MNRFIVPMVAALSLSMIGAPTFAATTSQSACSTEITNFDAAVKTTKAAKADITKAKKLRNKAAKLCKQASGEKKGEADILSALKLIGAQG